MPKLIHERPVVSVEARHRWTCDGCGRERPSHSRKVIVTEESRIVAQLCVFCYVGQDASAAERFVTEAARSGGVEDPFAIDWENAWEEVFGGCERESANGRSPEKWRG